MAMNRTRPQEDFCRSGPPIPHGRCGLLHDLGGASASRSRTGRQLPRRTSKGRAVVDRLSGGRWQAPPSPQRRCGWLQGNLCESAAKPADAIAARSATAPCRVRRATEAPARHCSLFARLLGWPAANPHGSWRSPVASWCMVRRSETPRAVPEADGGSWTVTAWT
jgi:hypothetical protein